MVFTSSTVLHDPCPLQAYSPAPQYLTLPAESEAGTTNKNASKISALSPSPPTLRLLPLLFLVLLNSITFSVNSQSLDGQLSILLTVKHQWGNLPALGGWNSTGSPSSICDLKYLPTLVLSWNYLLGEFPTDLYSCSKVQTLGLSQNYFVGQIPDDIDSLPNLQYLGLTGNNFTGDIPRAIGHLQKLMVLIINQNFLNGTFPADIGNLSKPEYLELAYNELTPMKIPPECGKLWMLRMTYLYWYENGLSGEIPSSILALNLTEIDLSDNNLAGSIPGDFVKLEELKILNLFYNQLSDQIATSLGLLPKLTDFNLFQNKLSGVLPPELGLHLRLESFQVCDNQLSGSLPENHFAGGVLLGVVALSNNLTTPIPNPLLIAAL
ncbi:hypothetical protein Nepgr_000926 [Nepenthes gracilis]|uniref:Uncharacterized protein n=1 Tax=Nepenthes gracilis TaxID=150966 RepID=A0AAD3RVS0_NEPGR|nr:hypothetical protein Nepgr_000926 [Nepenthes gracilis]